MTQLAPDLAPARLLAGLVACTLGRPLDVRASVASTNDLALDALARGAPHGALFVADEQTAGRGRRGNAWHSAPGRALHASLVLRCAAPLDAPSLLVAAVGLGLAEGLERASGATCGIKWPNDVWIGGRKVAGILVEARGYVPGAPAFVAGFGVNVSHAADEFPAALRASATSLALATGRAPERGAVLRAVLAALEPRLDEAFSGRTSALETAYRERSVLRGHEVALLDGERPVEGVVVDLCPRAGLLVRRRDGTHVHVRAEHAREVRPVAR